VGIRPQTRCYAEGLYAVDDRGLHQLDSASHGYGAQITGVALSADTLFWTHDGVVHRVALG
jgi:hypothetical protein